MKASAIGRVRPRQLVDKLRCPGVIGVRLLRFRSVGVGRTRFLTWRMAMRYLVLRFNDGPQTYEIVRNKRSSSRL